MRLVPDLGGPGGGRPGGLVILSFRHPVVVAGGRPGGLVILSFCHPVMLAGGPEKGRKSNAKMDPSRP